MTHNFWIYAKKGNIEYPIPNKKSGKWLLFVNIKFFDETWSVIKKDTENGKLGNFSKTVTLKPSPDATRENTKVICVYTNDYDNTDEVMRVRNELRNLGFIPKISYKADKATREGKYKLKGNKTIRLFHI